MKTQMHISPKARLHSQPKALIPWGFIKALVIFSLSACQSATPAESEAGNSVQFRKEIVDEKPASASDAQSIKSTQVDDSGHEAPAENSAITRLANSAILQGELCKNLVGSLIPVGASDSAPPPFSDGKAVGRLWVQRCQASAAPGGAIDIWLKGTGWNYLDANRNGFRIDEYFYFGTAMKIRGKLHGYHRDEEVIVRFAPSEVIIENLKVTSPLHPQADNVGSWLLDTATLGQVVPAEALHALEEEGGQVMAELLAQGMSVFFNTKTRRFKFGLGQMDSPPPEMPGTSNTTELSEALWLGPHGKQAMGPIPAGRYNIRSSIVERSSDAKAKGLKLAYIAVCQESLSQNNQSDFSGDWQSAQLRVKPEQISPSAKDGLSYERHCPHYLVVANQAAGIGVGSIWLDKVKAVKSDQYFISAKVKSFKIDSNRSWDAFGGAPDPKITATFRGRQIELGEFEDTFEGDGNLGAPLEFLAQHGDQIRYDFIDVDLGNDDQMGTAQLLFTQEQIDFVVEHATMKQGKFVYPSTLLIRADQGKGERIGEITVELRLQRLAQPE